MRDVVEDSPSKDDSLDELYAMCENLSIEQEGTECDSVFLENEEDSLDELLAMARHSEMVEMEVHHQSKIGESHIGSQTADSTEVILKPDIKVLNPFLAPSAPVRRALGKMPELSTEQDVAAPAEPGDYTDSQFGSQTADSTEVILNSNIEVLNPSMAARPTPSPRVLRPVPELSSAKDVAAAVEPVQDSSLDYDDDSTISFEEESAALSSKEQVGSEILLGKTEVGTSKVDDTEIQLDSNLKVVRERPGQITPQAEYRETARPGQKVAGLATPIRTTPNPMSKLPLPTRVNFFHQTPGLPPIRDVVKPNAASPVAAYIHSVHKTPLVEHARPRKKSLLGYTMIEQDEDDDDPELKFELPRVDTNILCGSNVY